MWALLPNKLPDCLSAVSFNRLSANAFSVTYHQAARNMQAAAQHGLAADTAGGGSPESDSILASWPLRPGAAGQRPRRS